MYVRKNFPSKLHSPNNELVLFFHFVPPRRKRERERWIDRQTDREREREARGRAACQAAVAHSAPLSRDVLSVPEHWRTPGIVLLPEIQRLRASRYRSHLHPSSFQPPAAVSPPVCVCVCAQPKPNATGIAWKRVEYHSTRI